MSDNDPRLGAGCRPRAGLLHFAKCAGSSVSESLIHAVGGVAAPLQQFDSCYLAGFSEPHRLAPEVAATVAWDDRPQLDAAYAFHQHWSLPTLRRHFDDGDLAAIAREPGVRVLSQVLFTRAMRQPVHRRWSPHTLPAEISRMPLVDLLEMPEAARVTDNLMVRQTLWGDSRIPHASFIADADVEHLATNAVERITALGCVGVVENLDAAWRTLERWLGVAVDRRHENRTREAQVPGLLRNTADVSKVVELLRRRNRADHVLWVHLAEQSGIDNPLQLADELVERKMRVIAGSTFLAGFDGRLSSAADRGCLVIGDDDGRVPVSGPTALVGRRAPADPSAYDCVVQVEPTANLGDLIAGCDFATVALGPQFASWPHITDQLAAVDAHLVDGYSLTALIEQGDVTDIVLAAIRCGWHVDSEREEAGYRCLRFCRHVAPDDDAHRQVTHYGIPIDLANEGDSRAVVLGAAAGYQRVLELGCSEGLMTRVMAQRGQAVTGVEFDPQAAANAARWVDQMLVADLDDPAALDRLGDSLFDLVIASDVLEHLRHPTEALRRIVRHVATGGRLILSIPNTAHGDVRTALLGGQLPYAPLGLLDHTHIHLFTYDSLMRLIADADLVVTEWRRTMRTLGDTEVPHEADIAEFLAPVFADDPHATTYQWIVTCARRGEGDAVADPLLTTALPPVGARLLDPRLLGRHLGLKSSVRATASAARRFARRVRR
jgi:2-polyprenyl-3-methyl-5-hydroxy-6-metoxy-1,4-benzoquinol methylase